MPFALVFLRLKAKNQTGKNTMRGHNNLRNRRKLGIREWKPEISSLMLNQETVGSTQTVLGFGDLGFYGEITSESVSLDVDGTPINPTSIVTNTITRTIEINYPEVSSGVLTVRILSYPIGLRNKTGAYIGPVTVSREF